MTLTGDPGILGGHQGTGVNPRKHNLSGPSQGSRPGHAMTQIPGSRMFPQHTASHVVCMTTAERGKVLNTLFCLMLPCPCVTQPSIWHVHQCCTNCNSRRPGVVSQGADTGDPQARARRCIGSVRGTLGGPRKVGSAQAWCHTPLGMPMLHAPAVGYKLHLRDVHRPSAKRSAYLSPSGRDTLQRSSAIAAPPGELLVRAAAACRRSTCRYPARAMQPVGAHR